MATAGATLSLVVVFLTHPSAKDVSLHLLESYTRLFPDTQRSVEQDGPGSTDHVLKHGDLKYHS